MSLTSEDLDDVWRAVEAKGTRSNEIVLIVVNGHDQSSPLKEFIKKKKKAGQIASQIAVVGLDPLQPEKDFCLHKNDVLSFSKLYIFAHCDVDCLEFHVRKFRNVNLSVFGNPHHFDPARRGDLVRLDGASSFWDQNILRWNQRADPRLRYYDLVIGHGFVPDDDAVVAAAAGPSTSRAVETRESSRAIASPSKGQQQQVWSSYPMSSSPQEEQAWLRLSKFLARVCAESVLMVETAALWSGKRGSVLVKAAGGSSSDKGGFFKGSGSSSKSSSGGFFKSEAASKGSWFRPGGVYAAALGLYADIGPRRLAIGAAATVGLGVAIYFVPWTDVFGRIRRAPRALVRATSDFFQMIWLRLKRLVGKAGGDEGGYPGSANRRRGWSGAGAAAGGDDSDGESVVSFRSNEKEDAVVKLRLGGRARSEVKGRGSRSGKSASKIRLR